MPPVAADPEVLMAIESTIAQAQAERTHANRLSDVRGELAPVVGVLVSDIHHTPEWRVAGATALALLWKTDRDDGITARRSVARIRGLVEKHPIVAEHPQAQHLISEETMADGAERDASTDKELANTITAGLIRRAVQREDGFGMLATAATKALTDKRDARMRAVRAQGRAHGIDVKAQPIGKAKTALLAVGQFFVAASPDRSVLNRVGHGLILGSNAPSWAALWAMDRHVQRELRTRNSVPRQNT